jgi:aryl-alcohol dehydrogenase-like predicted oxidoreductase
MQLTSIPTVSFGSSLHVVTRIGLGGEGVLRTNGRRPEAMQVIHAALDAGIGYFDSARVYADSELYYGSVWGADPAARQRVFQASKSAERGKAGALAELDQTLKRLQTDYLDLWQIHDIRTPEDLAMIGGPDGALEAFVEAKASGRVRFIGVTGHREPAVLTRAVEDWPVDAVMMPVNPVEGVLGGFLTSTLPAARRKNIAVIGMKVLGASHYLVPQLGLAADQLIRYALAQDITLAIVGCSDPLEVRALAEAGREPARLSAEEQNRLLEKFRPYARKLAYYRGGDVTS